MTATNKKKCGQCGEENFLNSNFCNKCGSDLGKNDSINQNEDFFPEKNANLKNISLTLKNLLKHDGFIIVSIGDFYVQFSNDLIEKQLYFEAVSQNVIPEIGNKTTEFKKLSFKLEDGNYFKFFHHSDLSIARIVSEIVIIFEDIYRKQLNSYTIETEFDGVCQTSQINNNTRLINHDSAEENINFSKITKSQRNWIIGIAVVVILIIIGYIGDHNSTSSSTLYYVNTTTYAATSKASFDEMFTYINEGDEQALSSLTLYGQMKILTSGTEVYLVSSHFSYCIVRLKSSTHNLWVVTEHITKK